MEKRWSTWPEDHIDNNSTRGSGRGRKTEKRYPGTTVCFVLNIHAPAEISYDGIKGWVSRLSIGFGGMHCFEGISNMAWKGPLCLPLLSPCYRLSPSCTRWHGRRLAGRVLTVAALTPLAHSLGSGSHARHQDSIKTFEMRTVRRRHTITKYFWSPIFLT